MKKLAYVGGKSLPPTPEAHDHEGVRVPVISEKFLTMTEVAEAIGFEVWKVRRAVKLGIFPSYRLLNKRRYVKLSEVTAIIEATRQGGAE